MEKKYFYSFLLLVFIFQLSLNAYTLLEQRGSVVSVINGHTLNLSIDGVEKQIFLWGARTTHVNEDPIESGQTGYEAFLQLQKLLPAETEVMLKCSQKGDFCFVYKKDLFINEELIKDGLAYIAVPWGAPPLPDGIELEKMKEALKKAMGKKTTGSREGLWKTVSVYKYADGDTLTTNFGAKIRFSGIDTPESVARDKACGNRERINYFGEEASDIAKTKLPAGSQIYLEPSLDVVDKYGRIVAYVWYGPKYSENLNFELLSEGYARGYLKKEFEISEKERNQISEKYRQAISDGKGLWNNRERLFMIKQIFDPASFILGNDQRMKLFGLKPLESAFWDINTCPHCSFENENACYGYALIIKDILNSAISNDGSVSIRFVDGWVNDWGYLTGYIDVSMTIADFNRISASFTIPVPVDQRKKFDFSESGDFIHFNLNNLLLSWNFVEKDTSDFELSGVFPASDMDYDFVIVHDKSNPDYISLPEDVEQGFEEIYIDNEDE
ncbi:MAG: thermonuclease family protein [Pseudomonadota bacterium]